MLYTFKSYCVFQQGMSCADRKKIKHLFLHSSINITALVPRPVQESIEDWQDTEVFQNVLCAFFSSEWHLQRGYCLEVASSNCVYSRVKVTHTWQRKKKCLKLLMQLLKKYLMSPTLLLLWFFFRTEIELRIKTSAENLNSDRADYFLSLIIVPQILSVSV